MTKDESRAITFLGVLLCLALVARYINRPKPITIHAGAVDIEALREAGRSLTQNPASGSKSRKRARAINTIASDTAPVVTKPWTTPAWKRGHGAAPVSVETSREEPAKADGPLNVNRATAKEIETLPGIGPAVAKRIITRRDSIGRFEKLADLDAVKGIGPALLKKIEPLVSF